jgi:hypothetical protein
MTIHDATVNDNRVTYTESSKGTERETTARRAASDLERDCDAINRVSAGVGGRVTVWLAHSHGHDEDKTKRFYAPDGWQIAYTDITSDGSIAVTIEETEDVL